MRSSSLARLVMATAASLGVSAFMPDTEESKVKRERKPRRSRNYGYDIPYLGLTVKRASHAHQQRLARKNKKIRARSPKR